MTTRRPPRMDFEEEQRIAQALLDLEAVIGELLAPVPECSRILADRSGPSGRTRAAAVDRLEAAVEALDRVRGHREVVAAARAKWREAQQLRWRLALSATPVVYREARRLGTNPSLGEQDLVQEGFVGLLAAAKRYEPNRDTRFATYARWWVRAQMTRAIDLGRVVHLSAGASEQLRNLRKQVRIYEASGVTWTVEDLAADVGLEIERTRHLLSLGQAQSLDEPSDDESQGIGAQLTDDSLPLPDDLCQQRQQLRQLHTVLASLPSRLQRIVTRRYGIGQEPKTLADIAKGMSLSRERVRKLEHQSLDILRDAYVSGRPAVGDA